MNQKRIARELVMVAKDLEAADLGRSVSVQASKIEKAKQAAEKIYQRVRSINSDLSSLSKKADRGSDEQKNLDRMKKATDEAMQGLNKATYSLGRA